MAMRSMNYEAPNEHPLSAFSTNWLLIKHSLFMDGVEILAFGY